MTQLQDISIDMKTIAAIPANHTAPATTMPASHPQEPPVTFEQGQPKAKTKTEPPAKGDAGTEGKSSSAFSNRSAKANEASTLVPVSNLPKPTLDDLRRLEELEALVSAALKAGHEAVESHNAAVNSRAAAVQAGNAAARALHEIQIYRDGILWRKDFKTFVDYCASRWGYRKSQAYRLTEFGSFIAESDKFSPIGENAAVPESHFRRFCSVVPKGHRVKCWQEITAGRDSADLTASKVKAAAIRYLEQHGLDTVPERPMDQSKARARAMGLLEKLRATVAGFSAQEKFDRALREFAVLIEGADDAPAIEVEATAADAGDVVVAVEIPEEVVAPENDDATDEETAPEVPAADPTDRVEPALTHEPSLPPTHKSSDLRNQPLFDEPAAGGMPVGKPAGNNSGQNPPFMDARTFHRAVLPAGSDFDGWFENVSAKHPGDFGISDNGEDHTISLVRARNIAFHAKGDLCTEALEIIQEVQASGVADPGEVANTLFDDLANGSYVRGRAREHGPALSGEERSEA